ncbi:MAG: hypothetical protein ACOCPX_04630 [Halapricum sp.]
MSVSTVDDSQQVASTAEANAVDRAVAPLESDFSNERHAND